MKRHGELFDAIFTRKNLFQAYLDARRGKRKKRATFEFETNLGAQLESLYWEIHAGTYQPRPYHTFWVHEPKPRLIYAPAFRDRVAQHAIYRMVYPLFDRCFVAESFACRPGYGTHKASHHLQACLKACDPQEYALKLDISKFFYRIDRSILRVLVERKIKDHRLVNLMMRFADHPDPVGIPIGNLLSQLYALIYLNPLDHYIKRDLKIQHYVRYVDDLVLVGLTRPEALALRARIGEFLADNLRLEFSRTSFTRISRGVNFVGYRTWRNRRLIRKHSLYKFRKAILRGDDQATVSILGHAKGTASLAYMISQLKEVPHENLCLPKKIRRLYDLPGPGHRRGPDRRAVHPGRPDLHLRP